MSDLAAALREAGHSDVADALEKKELAGRLRQNGRDDLADQLEAGGAAHAEEPNPGSPEQQLAEGLRDHLNNSMSPWYSLGGDDAA